jgi:ferredoxin
MRVSTLAGINLAAYLDPRPDVLLLPLLPPARQALPRHHVALQRLLHAGADRQRQTGGHGISDAQLDDLKSFGVKKFEDFTWKHMLDFYSCVDCGRCSDRCPANAVKRPLSPRFISIKARDYAFERTPIFGKAKTESVPL